MAHLNNPTDLKTTLNSLWLHKCTEGISSEDFVKRLKYNAQLLMLRKGVESQFTVDNNNREIIKQLYLYFIGSDECKWNIHSGLIFGGAIGAGKTTLLHSYVLTSNELLRKQITTYHVYDLVNELVEKKKIEHIQSLPLFIDEFGREAQEIKDFGTIKKPIIELLSFRYENGARTYATTNFDLEYMTEKYGKHVVSRIKEMCNYIVLPGTTRRKENVFK